MSVRGRKERKSAKRRKRRRRSGRRSVKRRGSARENGSVRGRETETENGIETETGTGTGDHGEATPTVATPVAHRTGKGADPEIAGGLGAETRTERGNANAAGRVVENQIYCENKYVHHCVCFYVSFSCCPNNLLPSLFLQEPGQGQGQGKGQRQGQEAQP